MVLGLGFRDFSPKQGPQLLASLAQGCTKANTSASKFLSPKFHFGSWETGKMGFTDDLSGVCVGTKERLEVWCFPQVIWGHLSRQLGFPAYCCIGVVMFRTF